MKIKSMAVMAMMGVMCASTAAAQEIPCRAGACLKKKRHGTHFIAEINGGGTLQRDGGFAVEGLFGAGGKVPLLPLRAYVIGELAYSTSYGSGMQMHAPLGYTDTRHYRDVSVGLRLYLPLWAGLRLLADVQGGGSHQSVALERADFPVRAVSGWSPHFQVAAGLQYRLLHHLSVGVRARVAFTDTDLAGLYAAVGEKVPLRTSLTAGITWHF